MLWHIFVFSCKAGTEGFRNAFGTFSETNIEIKYKNIVQDFVEKAMKWGNRAGYVAAKIDHLCKRKYSFLESAASKTLKITPNS